MGLLLNVSHRKGKRRMKSSFRAFVFSSTLLIALLLSPVTSVFAVTTPAEINKSFTPIAIVAGGTSTLKVTVYNPNENPLTSASWTDNLPAGMTIASPLTVVNTCGGSVRDGSDGLLEVGDTSFKLTNGTVPEEVDDIPGSCYVSVLVTSTTPGNLINTIPANALTSLTIDPDGSPTIPVPISNTTPASATLNVIAVASPSLNKAFAPNTIKVGETSRLTITVRNTDSKYALNDVTLTDTLPTNGDGDVFLADPVNATHSAGCGISASLSDSGGGALDPGDTTIKLNNGTIPKSTNCVIEVDVTSLTQGAYTNTIPAGPGGIGSIETREGVTNGGEASAPLNVQAFNLTKAFGTSPIAVGETSEVTITIQNDATIDYTEAALDDILPDGLEYLSTPAPATTCTSGIPGASVSIVTTTNPNDTLRLTDGTLPANSTCTITATARALMSADPGTYTNTIPVGELSTFQGATNHSEASAELDVQALAVYKAFWLTTEPTPPFPPGPAAVTVAAGQTANVTIWISNPSPNAFTNAFIEDVLPTSPNTNLYFTGIPTTDCGVGGIASITTTTNPDDTVQLTGGEIPGGSIASPGLCKIIAQVKTDAGDPAANNYRNTVPADTITTDEGGTNASASNEAVLNISTISLGKTFTPTTVSYPGASRLRITITNPATGTALTNVTLTDNLPVGLEVAPHAGETPPGASPAPVTTCVGGVLDDGGGNPLETGDTTIHLTGGSLDAGPSFCTVTVYVRPKIDTSSGTYTNTLGPGSVTTFEGPENSNTVNTNLTVTSVSVSKAFAFSSFQAGGENLLTITLRNHTTQALTGVSVSDTLPTSPNDNLFFKTGSETTTCGGAVSLSGAPNPRTVSLSGGTIPANNTCVITAIVTTDPGAPAASYTGANANTIPIGALTTTQGPKNTTAATAPVSVYTLGTGLSGTKSFTPATINIGENSHLQLTFTAPPDVDLTGFTFTDNLPAGVTVSNSTAASHTGCGTLAGAWPPANGASTIAASGGSILAGATCTIHVYVTSNTGSGAGILYTNSISPLQVSNIEGRTLVSAINAGLTVKTVSTLTIEKAFYPTIVAPDGLSTLTITLENSGTTALVNVILNDDLPGALANGVVVAPDPNISGTCASDVDITALPGMQTISMVNGTVPAQVGGVNGICTINVDVQGKSTNGSSPATHTNEIPPTNVTATISGTSSTMNAQDLASADLTVRNIELEVVKGFDPQLVYGGAFSEMSIILRNPNTTASLTGIQFTDNMWLDPPDPNAYPAGQMILADPPNLDPSDCGPAASMTGNAGDSTFSFSGGYLDAGEECTITLDVTMIVNGNRTNRIPALAVTSFNGAKNKTATEATLTNLAGASVSKDFAPNPIPAGLENYSILTITIRTTATVNITQMGLVDTLPAGLEVAGGSAPAPVNGCGGTLTANPGDDYVQLTGGSLLIGFSSCAMTIPVTGANPGVYTNDIPIGAITSYEGITNKEPTDAELTLTPYSLGNRVWYDTNNDGLLNNAEAGIEAVRVELYHDDGSAPGVYDSSDTYITFRNTNSSGHYRFDDLSQGEYVVVIPASNFQNPGDPLYGYLSSGTEISSAGVISDGYAPSPETTVTDSDDNGGTTFNAYQVDYVSSQAVALGPGSNEPVTESDPATNPETGEAVDNQSNRTVDFGFYTQQLGNLIFFDDDQDGAFGGADTGLGNAQVQLFAGNSTTEMPVGVDGILGTTDDAPGGVTTPASGAYLFGGLPEGSYVVKVRAPIAYSSTIDTANFTDTTTPNTNIDLNDNGVGEGGGLVSSNMFTMTPGVAGTSTTVDNNLALTDNPSIDFGYLIQPYSLGNRVWFDTNNDGLMNNGEVGLENVRVELYLDDGSAAGVYDSSDTYVDFLTTDASGYYRFDNLSVSDYVVLIPADNFRDTGAGDTVPGDPLAGYLSSGTAITFNGVISDGIGPDPDDIATDSDDNGVSSFSGSSVNYVSAIAVEIGPGSVEPATDNDPAINPEAGEAPNEQSNRTVDFGFYRQKLGNQIFVDIDNDGMYTGGTDKTLSDAVVQLFAGDGTTKILVGADGILGTSDDSGGGDVITTATGIYLFGGLPQGQYIVKVTPPDGNSTIDTGKPGDTTNPNNNIDHNDNGVGVGAGQVASNVFNMTPGAAGASTTVNNSNATTDNPSIDFGFAAQYSLGNRVWFDTDNNGFMDGAEVGVSAVRVALYVDDGSKPGVYDAADTFVAAQSTSADGHYRFDHLGVANYVVVIPADNFRDTGGGDTVPGDPLEGYLSSGSAIAANGVASDGIGPDPDGAPTDSDDNGVTTFSGQSVNYVSSRAVSIGPGANEPLLESDPLVNPEPGEAPDDQSNRTVDFGFYRLQLGDLIFQDFNLNGTYDGGDSPLPNANVQVFASDGVTEINVGVDGILGTSDDGAGGVTTGVSGTYQFGGLPAGNYIVTVQPTGFPSTVDTAEPNDTTNPNQNVNNNDNGVGTSGSAVSSNIVTLTPGDSGLLANNIVDSAAGSTYNPTVDFGYITSLSKKIVPPDDAPHTTPPFVTIGEIVTYEVSFNVPSGLLKNVKLIDVPQQGLAFVDCLTINLPTNVTSTEFGTGGACSARDGTDPTTSNPLIENSGKRTTFKFGDINNATLTSQVVTVQYSMVVLDTAPNISGKTLTNSATWSWTGGSFNISAPLIEIVEPQMVVLKKAEPTTVQIGDSVTFTIDISHALTSTEDAYDVIFTDRIPDGMTYDPTSLVVTGTATLTSSSYDPVTKNLKLTWDIFRLGETATVKFKATFDGPSPITNTAYVEWTSLEIDPTQRSPYNPASTERFFDPGSSVNGYGASSPVVIQTPSENPEILPETGFAPGKVTRLPEQPEGYRYTALGDLWLEIPSLGAKASITGIPKADNQWDITWLADQAGWLEGTSYPTWNGNSVITGHVYLPDGKPGPFVNLSKLRWGDQVILHAYGQRYIYEVQTNHIIQPTARSPFKHEEKAWLTLLTCLGYDEKTNTYQQRVETRAVLVRVEPE